MDGMKTESVSEHNTSRGSSKTDGNEEEYKRVAPNDVNNHVLCGVHKWKDTLPHCKPMRPFKYTHQFPDIFQHLIFYRMGVLTYASAL